MNTIKGDYLDEEKVITHCKKDLYAFSKIYERYVEDVYRYIYAVIRDKEKSEDIASKAFLIALEKVKSFEWKGVSIKFWLLRISRNLIYESFEYLKTLDMILRTY